MSIRPQFSVFIAISLDGYIARPDGGLDWLQVVERPGEDYGYRDFTSSVDVMVMGRGTYDAVLGFPDWPYAGKRCIVLSQRPTPPRHGEEFFCAPLPQLVEKLTRESARRVYVDGGQVIRQFLAARLIDDLTLSIIPVLLGAGIPLFSAAANGALAVPGIDQSLQLKECRSFESGLVQLRYGCAPSPKTSPAAR